MKFFGKSLLWTMALAIAGSTAGVVQASAQDRDRDRDNWKHQDKDWAKRQERERKERENEWRRYHDNGYYNNSRSNNGYYGPYSKTPAGALLVANGASASLSDRGWVSLTLKTTF